MRNIERRDERRDREEEHEKKEVEINRKNLNKLILIN